MMNRYIYCFAITLLTSACGFLDIDTPGIVSNDKMFENGQGFMRLTQKVSFFVYKDSI